MPVIDALINKFLLKPIGFPFVLISFAFICMGFFPSAEESYTKFNICIVICFVALISYCIVLICINKMPRAKNNELGVLFLIRSENEGVYKEAKFNIVENFNNIVNKFDTKFTAKCIDASTIKNYNLGDKKQIIKLLKKTNCFFSVEIFYQVDSVNNATNYQLKINTSSLHPKLSKNFLAILQGELIKVSEPISNVKFTKDQKLQKLDVTVEQLCYIVKYILGLTLFLDKSYSYAIVLFDELYKTDIISIFPTLSTSFKKIYYNLCLMVESNCIDEFNDTHDYAKLDIAEHYLIKMNEIIPDTYGFHLDMAKVSFIKYRNSKICIEHIERCRSLNDYDSWKYSDAFLTAYISSDINLICKKYEAAIKSSYNIISIIDFVENILLEEPTKYTLHLALTILYNAYGDTKLTMSNLRKFQKFYNPKISDTAYKKLLNKLNSKCLECNNLDCSICSKVA